MHRSSTTAYGPLSDSWGGRPCLDKKIIFVNKGVFYVQFVSLSIIIESLLWSLVVNNMTPDQIMNDTFGNGLDDLTFHDSFIITGTFVVYWHNNFGPIIYVWVFLALAYFKNPLLVQSEYFLSSRVSK